MIPDIPSRRTLLLTGLVTALAPRATPQSPKPLTAADILDRIKQNIGIPWRAQTVDKLVAGTPDTHVTGIATTMMATLDVLQRAAAAQKNFVITHETPFYQHTGQTEDLAGDPTLDAKLRFIREHNLAIFHFHDHWHGRHPDGIAQGMNQQLGWTKNADPNDPRHFTFPGASLEQIASELQQKLNIRTPRVVGDPKLPIHRAFASWGFVSRMPGITQFREPGLDLFIAGETREWELVEYVEDSITAGQKKALIILGHIVSEQGGMQLCAEWLKPLVPEVPVAFIPAREPFWTPDDPPRS